MSARRQIIAALSEDNLGGIATLAGVPHAEQLVNALVAEVRLEDADFVGNDDTCDCGGCATCIARHLADSLRAMAGQKATAPAATATPDLTIYQASHDSIVMGLYDNRQAAYEHCEADELRDDPISPMAWEVDEDGTAELVRWHIPDVATPTGFVVTPLTVASEYDEEAEE